MPTTRSWFLPLLVLASSGPAHAASVGDVAQQLDAMNPDRRRAVQDTVRIQVSYQLQVPSARDMTLEDQAKATMAAHVVLYALASHECEEIVAVNTGDCRMIALNIGGIGFNYGPQPALSQIIGNATFEVRPSPTPAPDTSKRPSP